MSLTPAEIIAIAASLTAQGNTVSITADGSITVTPVTPSAKAGNAERCRRYRMSKHVEPCRNHVETMSRHEMTCLPSPPPLLSPTPPILPAPTPVHTHTHAREPALFETQGQESIKPHKRITWDHQDGWKGITAKDREQFIAAAPAVDIDRALSAASLWLQGNPTKRKQNHYRFFVNWITRQQERGGERSPPQSKFNGSKAGPHAPDPTTEHGF